MEKEIEDIIRNAAHKIELIERELLGNKDYGNPGVVKRLSDVEMSHASLDMRIDANHRSVTEKINALEKKNESWDFKKGVYMWVGGAVIGTGTWIASHPFIIKLLVLIGLVKQAP